MILLLLRGYFLRQDQLLISQLKLACFSSLSDNDFYSQLVIPELVQGLQATPNLGTELVQLSPHPVIAIQTELHSSSVICKVFQQKNVKKVLPLSLLTATKSMLVSLFDALLPGLACIITEVFVFTTRANSTAKQFLIYHSQVITRILFLQPISPSYCFVLLLCFM